MKYLKMIKVVVFITAFFLLKASGFAQAGISDILIQPEELASITGQIGVVIVDASEKESYEKTHLPGAVSLPGRLMIELKDDVYMKQTGMGLRPEKIEELFGKLGISNNSRVIVYDSGTDMLASFVWAILKIYGVDNAQILAGGKVRWKKEKRPLTSEIPKPKPAVFKAKPNPELVATAEWIIKNKENINLVDTRTTEEYIGALGPGRIPGSLFLDYIQLTDPKGTFKSTDELNSMLSKLGVTRDKEVVPYCNFGAKAAFLFAALKGLGYKSKLYWGSMEDWVKDTTLPIAKGK